MSSKQKFIIIKCYPKYLAYIGSVQLYENGIYEEIEDRRFKDGQIYIWFNCCYGLIKQAVHW